MKLIYSIFLFLLTYSLACANEKELYIYNWSEYLPDNVIKEFTKETGIKVIYSTYDSNEAMYAKVKLLGKNSNYDLMIPSSYYVNKMRNEGLLSRINKELITNLKNLDPNFLNKSFDINNEYSIPYLWGCTGIAYNSKYIKDKVDSWNVLFDNKYKNKLLLMDDVREAFHIALVLLGYSGNDTDRTHVEKAYEKLRTVVPNVKVWNSESPKTQFINEEVIIGTIWNGEAYMASLDNPSIKFAYPKEGVILWVDSFVIPKYAKNIENAHKFIDFILRPEVAKVISEKIGFGTPNKVAFDLLPQSVRSNVTVYPPKEYVSKGEYQNDVGSFITVYEKYWEMLKSGVDSGKD